MKNNRIFNINRDNFKHLSWTLMIFTMALVLRSINLNKDLSGDEGLISYISSLRIDDLITALLKREVYPPLTYLLLHFWRMLCGTTVWIRLYFIIFGMGVCFLVYKMAKDLFDKRFANIVLLLAAFSPLLIYLSQYARSYIDSAFWIILSCYTFLRIVNQDDRLRNWVGYIVAMTLALYTFYFSVFFFFAQMIYLVLFCAKDRRLISKWIFAVILAGILFAPWLPYALKQFSNGSSLIYDWSTKGFNIFGLKLGLYTRNIFSLAGMDPSFMVFKGSVSQFIRKDLLAAIAALTLAGAIIFLKASHKSCIRNFPQQMKTFWFLFILTFVPLLLSWLSASFLNVIPNAKYLVVTHVFFIFFIGLLIYQLFKVSLLRGILSCIFLLSLFIMRLPVVLSPDFEISKTRSFQKMNIHPDDCLLCVFSPYPLEEGKNVITLKEGEYFALNSLRSEYTLAGHERWSALEDKLSNFKKVWYIRMFSIQEVFGLNQRVIDWLTKSGFRRTAKFDFRNMELILFEKP